MSKIYGYASDGTPLRTQKEVVRDYFVHNTGASNALSHTGCEQKFGFKRLSALVFDIEKEDKIVKERGTHRPHAVQRHHFPTHILLGRQGRCTGVPTEQGSAIKTTAVLIF